jgi:hypothetical protein
MPWFAHASVLFACIVVSTASGVDVIDGETADERATAFLNHCATERPRREDYPKEAMAYYLARLIRNTDTKYAITKIEGAAAAALKASQERLAKDPNDGNALDPFNKHALLNGYLICPGKFSETTVKTIRAFIALHGHREWRGFGSMNYRLMKDGSGFIASEQWPDLRDADGLSAEEIRKATAGRLYGYFDTIVRKNLDEYSGPTYYTTDLMMVRMLAEFAKDTQMKGRATMTLDWMMLNLACSWNQGYNIATAGRSKGWGCVTTGPDGSDTTAAVGWIYFGGLRGINPVYTCQHHTFWMAYPGNYKLPSVVYDVALDRGTPFAARESVLSVGGCDIRKSLWQSTAYGLTCQWEFAPNKECGLFKETKRHMMKWVSDKAVSTFSIQQENYLRPYRPKDKTPNAFGYGENPFHQLMQHEATQIGVYAVPEDYPFYKLYVPFTTQGAIVIRLEKNGWVFCHGGSVLFGFKLVKPGAWGKPQNQCDILWSEQHKNGWVLETSEVKPYVGESPDAELERFGEDVLKKCKIDASGIDAAQPQLKYTSLQGRQLEIAFRPFGEPYVDQHKIDGKPVDYRAFPLMENPWVSQAVDGDILTVKRNGVTRTWDFKRWSTAETKQ